MGEVLSIYEGIQDLKTENQFFSPTVSNKTLYIYIRQEDIENKNIQFRRRSLHVHSKDGAKQMFHQHINSSKEMVSKKSNMKNPDKDQFIIPTNTEVPKVVENKNGNNDKKIQEVFDTSEFTMRKSLDSEGNRIILLLYKYKEFQNELCNFSDLPKQICCWKYEPTEKNICEKDDSKDEKLGNAVMKKCYVINMKKIYDLIKGNFFDNVMNIKNIRYGPIVFSLKNMTWLNIAYDNVFNIYGEGNYLTIWKPIDLPFCFRCYLKIDKYVSRDYQSQPRDCLKCKIYRAEKGSADDLVQWAEFNQMLHTTKPGGEFGDYSINSPVSEISQGSIHLHETTGVNSCCSDLDDGHEKRSILEDKTLSHKRRRTDLEESDVSNEKNETVDPGKNRIGRNDRLFNKVNLTEDKSRVKF